jgi:general secretion pathway protein A
MDYTTYWQLRDRPFEERCDPRFFFESEEHREALDRMLYVVNDRTMSMGLLTGEIGSGKTMTRTVLTGSLPTQRFVALAFDNSDIPFDDMVYDVIRRLDAQAPQPAAAEPDRGDRYALMEHLRARLEQLTYRDKRHAVVLFDEAQQMSDATLGEIRNLTNLFSASDPLLTVLLVGQPELRDKIRRLKHIDQRIFLRFHLNNLDYADTVRYIQHRLRVGGREHDGVFTEEAYGTVFRGTSGVPREINRLCTLALLKGMAEGATEIAHADIEAVLADMGEHH